MSSFKRPREPVSSYDDSSASSTPSPTLKAARTSATPPPPGAGGGPSTSSGHILCTLPPTCNPPNKPTSLSGTRDLEAHYAMYHAHVCEEGGCGSVFPDARLLELHQTECHDPLAAVRKERGEKIFACHLASCPRRFSAPKTRRLHLIQAHGYPKEYFFAVTNKGVGGLLKKWGEGASLLRRPWQRRENDARDEDEEDDTAEVEMDAGTTDPAHEHDDDSDDDDEILLEKMPLDWHATGPSTSNGTGAAADQSIKSATNGKTKGKAKQSSADVDALAGDMDSLSLVPSSIQFGRGAKRGALQNARGRGASSHVRRGSAGRGADVPMDLDHHVAHIPRGAIRGRGRGAHISRGGVVYSHVERVERGRGRGGGLRGFGGPRGAMVGRGIGRGVGTRPGRGVGRGGRNV
ncbi:hypothetical protein C8Q78DRAFT_356304 [Trametes maxima]|nr:hypothetical protein C8Q78DRAFT_356304 [Trametes maxima]